jgi:Na+-translocating ferredoxin:NAD+ oxidoreductase RnfD subunit
MTAMAPAPGRPRAGGPDGRPANGARPPVFVLPRLRDPRVTLSVFLTLYTILGQTVLYFNRDLSQILVSVAVCCGLEIVLGWAVSRVILFPISAYITGLSIGILIESYDTWVFVAASVWGITSKYLIRDRQGHFFNPSNFAVVTALALTHGLATVAPGSQWGGKAWIAIVILVLGTVMMHRVNRLDLVGTWLAGFVVMAIVRMAIGQGGIVFTIGPMLGGEFALFSFSMLPDPKTSPHTRKGRILWGAGIALMDGVMRALELRYSMFIALFAFCAALPLFRRVFGGARLEPEHWKTIERPLSR